MISRAVFDSRSLEHFPKFGGAQTFEAFFTQNRIQATRIWLINRLVLYLEPVLKYQKLQGFG